MARVLSHRFVTFASLTALSAAATLGACILADPPAQLPTPVVRRPVIVHDAVSPPSTSVLRDWPGDTGFQILVEVDPLASFKWEAYVDFDPLGPSNPYVGQGQSDPDPAAQDGGTRLIVVQLPPPVDLDRCHTIEILVANDFNGHSALPPGGDTVSWLYAPTGTLGGCPVWDAGPPAKDAAAEGGDGGDGAIEGGAAP